MSKPCPPKSGPTRKGAVLVLAAAVLVLIFCFAAFSIDVGYIALTRSQLQNAADAAALAAANEISGTLTAEEIEANAKAAAVATAAANKAGDKDTVYITASDVQLGRREWNASTGKFDLLIGPQYTPYTAVKVTVSRNHNNPVPAGAQVAPNGGLPLFFAPILGINEADLKVTAVASFQPRDIMLVLDFSASMNDDSTFNAVAKLGQSAIEANLQQMWSELGNPTYGTLAFTPKYATVTGQPASGSIPQVTVEWRETSIKVTSTKDLSNVVLKFSNGSTQKFDGLTGKTGTFQGTGSNSGKTIVTAWIKSGSNSSGDCSGCGERFDYNATAVKKAFGLNSVAYPYPSGSWDSYISYADSSTSLKNAGYRRKFGGMNLLTYWLENQPSAAQTPVLWKTSHQPTQSLKDGVNLLLDTLTEYEGEDRMGLAIYTHNSSAGAILESPFTSNLESIRTIVKHRQAGHYDPYTNIGAGMKIARQQLTSNARPKAFRLMVLMTDGIANRPTNTSTAKALVLSEAAAAASAGIQIMTISLGAEADTALMQQVADLTGGIHFNVPGGSSPTAYSEQLTQVFREIAAARPLKLIRDNE